MPLPGEGRSLGPTPPSFITSIISLTGHSRSLPGLEANRSMNRHEPKTLVKTERPAMLGLHPGNLTSNSLKSRKITLKGLFKTAFVGKKLARPTHVLF